MWMQILALFKQCVFSIWLLFKGLATSSCSVLFGNFDSLWIEKENPRLYETVDTIYL